LSITNSNKKAPCGDRAPTEGSLAETETTEETDSESDSETTEASDESEGFETASEPLVNIAETQEEIDSPEP